MAKILDNIQYLLDMSLLAKDFIAAEKSNPGRYYLLPD
jgi:hypothetical protein